MGGFDGGGAVVGGFDGGGAVVGGGAACVRAPMHTWRGALRECLCVCACVHARVGVCARCEPLGGGDVMAGGGALAGGACGDNECVCA